jgi:hypothetical protein
MRAIQCESATLFDFGYADDRAGAFFNFAHKIMKVKLNV